MAGKFSLLTTLVLDATGYNQGINKAKQSTKELIETTEGINKGIKTLAALGVSAMGVAGAVDLFKKSMESTDATGDAFAKSMQITKEITDNFFRTLANGNWSNFLSNMDKAIKAGKDYADAIDYIENKQRGADISNSEDIKQVAQLRLDLIEAKKSNNPTLVKSILDRIEKIEQGMIDRNINIANSKYLAEVNKVTSRGINETDLIDFVKYTQEGENKDALIQQYKTLASNLLSAQLQSQQTYTTPDAVIAIKPYGGSNVNSNIERAQKEIQDFLNKNPEILRFKFLLDNANDVDFKAISKTIIDKNDAITAGLTRIRKPLMQEALMENKLLSKSTEDSIKKTKEYKDLQNQIIAKVKELDISNKKADINNSLRLTKEISLLQKKQTLLENGGELIKPLKANNLIGGSTAGIFESDKLLNNAAINKLRRYKKEVSDEVKELNSIATNGLISLASSFTSAFANIITGEEGAGFKQLFSGILNTVGQFITQMGEAVVAYGVTMEAFKKAFVNPFAAIAAGIGLMIAGGVVSNLAQRMSSNKFADGGIVGGNSFSGDKITARVNSGEMILNQSQQAKLFALANGSTVGGGEVVFRIDGNTLVGVLNNHNKRLNNFR